MPASSSVSDGAPNGLILSWLTCNLCAADSAWFPGPGLAGGALLACSTTHKLPRQKKGHPRLPVPCTVMGWQSPNCPPQPRTLHRFRLASHKGNWRKLAKHKCVDEIWGLSGGPDRKTSTTIHPPPGEGAGADNRGCPGKSQSWRGTGGYVAPWGK